MTSKENAFKDRDMSITTKFLNTVQNILANALRHKIYIYKVLVTTEPIIHQAYVRTNWKTIRNRVLLGSSYKYIKFNNFLMLAVRKFKYTLHTTKKIQNIKK